MSQHGHSRSGTDSTILPNRKEVDDSVWTFGGACSGQPATCVASLFTWESDLLSENAICNYMSVEERVTDVRIKP
jgi:hypothetical protein